jgi:uncharacterized phage protein gp47/JayE
MADQLISTGLEIDSLEDRVDNLRTDLRSKISSTLDVSVESPEGQLGYIFCDAAQRIAELIQSVHVAQYPDGADGTSLEQLARLTGTYRRAATYSTIEDVTVNVDAGTYTAGTLIAHVVDNPDYRFVSSEDAINAGPGAADVDIDFIAETAGQISAPASTLTVIAEPVSGWNSVTNDTAAVTGSDEETDNELRVRRVEELQTGAANVNSIVTAITQLTGIEWASVVENDTDAAVGGVPAHTIHPIVRATTATDEEIATAIFESKPAGIGTHGASYADVEDSGGTYHRIYFDDASVVEFYLEVDVTTVLGQYGGDDEVKQALVDYQEASLGIGDTIYQSQLAHAVIDGVTGIADVSEIRIGIAPSPTSTDDYALDSDEYPSFATIRITVTAT